MDKIRIRNFLKEVLENSPEDWIKLTTHRLDIYDESQAKTQFLEQFDRLFQVNNTDPSALRELPTAYDYIRLGHPLSSVLEWSVARINDLDPTHIISFSSGTMPILAVLRKNLLDRVPTRIYYTGELPASFHADKLRQVYGYDFELKKVQNAEEVSGNEGSSVFISKQEDLWKMDRNPNIDFYITIHPEYGSVVTIHGENNAGYISEIQHVRRRETIAMTPVDCYAALQLLTGETIDDTSYDVESDKKFVLDSIREITGTTTKPLLGSSGLSMQYAIMMGLVDDALKNHPGKKIKFVVPPNCYGGTNDQARRVAACLDQVEIVDLPVDGGHDMVQGVETVLTEIANADAIPYIIAEIPTNPRVQVPDLSALEEALRKKRMTPNGSVAMDPVFILDQTFCPNVRFVGEGAILSTVRTISYVSGSKFPSGGLVTAGYCVGNERTNDLMEIVEHHLNLCDNEATSHQIEILASQLPSMNQRIEAAYQNTREFVNFIREVLPDAKINFVSEELANQGFTPSVFSLDLPASGNTEEEREANKRALNLKLIQLMIAEIPQESKFCVSYGQLKGCYWTIPATSTQGTTKEGDKDYIVRVSLSPDVDLELHKKFFLDFVSAISTN